MLKSLFSDFVDTIFPSECLTCNNFLIKGEEIICLKCIIDLFIPDYKINFVSSYIREKFYGKIIIKHIFSFIKFGKKNKIRLIIHNLKYKDKTIIGEFMGRLYGNFIKEIGYDKEIDLIMPVPLHPKRYQKRGYNQSDFFAKGISETISIPWKKEYIQRKTNTKSQTKIPDEWTRWQNIKNAFEIKKNISLSKKNVLLVDDVMTSGSTLEACSHKLLECGASSISIATVAYA